MYTLFLFLKLRVGVVPRRVGEPFPRARTNRIKVQSPFKTEHDLSLREGGYFSWEKYRFRKSHCFVRILSHYFAGFDFDDGDGDVTDTSSRAVHARVHTYIMIGTFPSSASVRFKSGEKCVASIYVPRDRLSSG